MLPHCTIVAPWKSQLLAGAPGAVCFGSRLVCRCSVAQAASLLVARAARRIATTTKSSPAGAVSEAARPPRRAAIAASRCASKPTTRRFAQRATSPTTGASRTPLPRSAKKTRRFPAVRRGTSFVAKRAPQMTHASKPPTPRRRFAPKKRRRKTAPPTYVEPGARAKMPCAATTGTCWRAHPAKRPKCASCPRMPTQTQRNVRAPERTNTESTAFFRVSDAAVAMPPSSDDVSEDPPNGDEPSVVREHRTLPRGAASASPSRLPSNQSKE